MIPSKRISVRGRSHTYSILLILHYLYQNVSKCSCLSPTLPRPCVSFLSPVVHNLTLLRTGATCQKEKKRKRREKMRGKSGYIIFLIHSASNRHSDTFLRISHNTYLEYSNHYCFILILIAANNSHSFCFTCPSKKGNRLRAIE